MIKTQLKLLPLYLLLCCMPFNMVSQTRTFEDVLEARLKNMGAIYQGNQVKGYFMFYYLDRAQKMLMANFKIIILDEDLNVIAEKAIVELNTIQLLSVGFNGTSLLAEFYDNTAYSKYIKQYDLKLNLITETQYRFGSTWDLLFQSPFSHGKHDWQNIAPIQNKGFVYYYNIDNYRMQFFPDGGGKGWDVKAQDGDIYAAGYLAHSDRILLNTVVKKKNKRLKKMETFVQGIDLSNGKLVFEKPISTPGFSAFAMSGYLDDAGAFVVTGKYDDFGDANLAAKYNCEGFFTMKISEKGEVLAEKMTSLASLSTTGFKVDEKGKVNGDAKLRIHDAGRTKDGNLYFIGELAHFEKTLEKSFDMVALEFTPDLNLASVNIFNKTTRQEDKTEYHFLLYNPDASRFSFFYKTINADKKPTQEYMNIQTKTSEKGKFTQDIISLPAAATVSNVLPAKYGHVLLVDYFRKEKKLDMRIEKFNQ